MKTDDKNKLPSVWEPQPTGRGTFYCRFAWYDHTGKRRSSRGYGQTPARAKRDATDRWWAKVNEARDILHGRAPCPDTPKPRLVDVVDQSRSSLAMAQRPKQVSTTLHYMAEYWAGWCPSCFQLNSEAYTRGEGVLITHRPTCQHCDHPLLGEAAIDTITPAQCNGVLSAVRGVVKLATVNRIRQAAAVVFRFAVLNNHINQAPTDSVKRLREPKTIIRVMSGPDALALARAIDEEWRAFILLMLCAGLRLGEARTLERADVDLSRGLIYVCRGGADDSPKGNKERIVPIVSSRLRRELQAASRRSDRTVVRGRIDPRKPIARACKAAGIDPVTRHAMRHWFCSAALALRVPVPVVKNWLGHSEIGVTDRYAHALGPSKATAELLDELGPHAH